MKRHVLVVLSAVGVAACATAGPPRPITLEQSLSIQRARSVALSPDGSRVAWVLSTPRAADEPPGRAHNAVWVMHTTESAAPRRYTRAGLSASAPGFTPDSKRLVFVSKRGDDEDAKSQLWAMPLDGGEASAVTKAPDGVMAYKLSPDGTKLAFTTLAPKDPEREAAAKEGLDQIVVDAHPRHRLLQVQELASGEVVTVTPTDVTALDFDWSPDGTRLAVMIAPSPGFDDTYMRRSLWTFPARGGAGRKLAEKMGKMASPKWSPDGERILWHGASVPKDATTGTIWITASGGGRPKALNAGATETVYDARWLPDGAILATAVRGTRTHLSRWTVEGEQSTVLENGPTFLSVSVDAAGERFAFSATTASHPDEVYLGTLEDGEAKRTTVHNPELAAVDFAEQETIEWAASDGLTIQGVLVRPLPHDSSVRYPLVVMVHGGPEWQSLDGFNERYIGPAQLLAGRGYAVLLPNYRGSAGRGAAFAMADHRDLGGQEFQDIIDGVAHLVAEELVDPKRVGMMGGSYGGYMSALAATKGTATFAAAINFAGIANWWSFTGTSDIPHENSLVHWDLYCHDSEENSQKCWRGSPLAYIGQAKTPLLLLHGADDARVPPSQSRELYTAFRIRRIPVEMVLYPREGHGLAERGHQKDSLERIMGWFDRYLKAQPEG